MVFSWIKRHDDKSLATFFQMNHTILTYITFRKHPVYSLTFPKIENKNHVICEYGNIKQTLFKYKKFNRSSVDR